MSDESEIVQLETVLQCAAMLAYHDRQAASVVRFPIETGFYACFGDVISAAVYGGAKVEHQRLSEREERG